MVRFGEPAGRQDRVDPQTVAGEQRRAEIRCPVRHLVGVVTNDKIIIGYGHHDLLGAIYKILVFCPRCPRSSPEYDVDPRLVRRLLDANPRRRRFQINIEDVATIRRNVHSPRG